MLFAVDGQRRSRQVTIAAVVLDLESCPETDVTSLEMLDQLHNELHDAGIGLYLARVADPVQDLFDRGGFLERLSQGRVFPEVGLGSHQPESNAGPVPAHRA